MGFYSGSLLLTSLASLGLGIFVFFKGRNKLPNIALGLFSFSLALWCFSQFMGEVVESKSLVLFWTRFGIGGAISLPVFFLCFILSLIEKAATERKLIYFVCGLGLLFLILDFTRLFVGDIRPVLKFRYYPVAGPVYPFFAIFIGACFLYAFFRLFMAYRESLGAKKNQLLYVILASAIGFLGGITAFFPVWGMNFPVISHFALPLYVLITVYAILKHRLLDISIIIREGLVYSTLTLLFTGFYVLAILTANYLFANLVGIPMFLTVLIVVFASLLVFQPAKDSVQKAVDRLFFRGEYRYLKTIDDLSEENRKLFRSLLQADKLASLGTISAGMAHEIKNPLASIKGMTQVIEENLSDPGFIKKYQDVVSRQIDRINSLVEKLLRFGPSKEISFSAVDLNKILDEVLGLLESQMGKKNISLSRDLAKLPEIKGDAEQLSQVFMNLILNAVQAMPGGGKLSIKTAVAGANNLCIEVSDTGLGIAADKLDNIFDPFFTTKEEGSGMGLAVTYRIIKEHGGEIQVESQEGKGTKFSLWLPIKPGQ